MRFAPLSGGSLAPSQYFVIERSVTMRAACLQTESASLIAIICWVRGSQQSFGKSTAKIKSCWLLGNRTKPSSLSVIKEEKQNLAFNKMMTALPIRTLTASPILLEKRNPSVATKGGDGAGLLQVLGNPSDWKFTATIVLVFFVASLAVAPALAPDCRKLAAGINNKTLRAAAAVKSSTR